MAKIQRKADRRTRRRIAFAAVLFCVLCSAAIICRLAWLQIINQEFYEKYALGSQTRDVTIYPTRGTIYDTNGKPLAISAATEMLIVNPRQIRPQESSNLTDAERLLLGFDLESKYTLTDQQKDTIKNNRITIGNAAEMQTLVDKIKEILEEK